MQFSRTVLRHPLWMRPLLALLAIAATLACGPSLFAQYESNPIDESAKRFGSSRAKRYARSPSNDQAERVAFGKYIRDYYLASLTQPDAASLADLGRSRYDYMRSYLWGAAPSVQDDLTKLTFAEMREVVRGRYHPAVRYNSMLIIGQLDSKYESQGSPPEPLPEANEFLTKYVSVGIGTAKAPAPLIVGAMLGLERHAKSLQTLPPANQAATAKALLAVLEAEDFPHEISSSVKQWWRVIAARGLANVGVLGDGNRVHKAMFAVIGDEKSRLNNRVRVAELLEAYRPAYESAGDIDQKSAAQTLLQLASDIAADEKERAVDYEDESIGGGRVGGGGRGGGRGGGFRLGGDTDLPDEYQIRRLLLRLTGLKTAINAVKPAIKDDKFTAPLDAVVSAIDPVISEAKDRNLVLLNLTQEVKQMADSVTATTASLGVEAVEAPPESDEEAAEELLEQEIEGEAENVEA